MSLLANEHANCCGTSYLGLAPFLRDSIAGKDLRCVGANLLDLVSEYPTDPSLLMNASLAMQCIGQRDLGLAFQSEALSIQRIFPIPATDKPARLKVLLLMVPGDIAANTPLECLLETSDIDLVFYYLSSDEPFSVPIPEHDILLVALGESEDNRRLLNYLETKLIDWPKPIVNHPRYIPRTDRHVVSQLLQGAPRLVMPLNWPLARTTLLKIANGESSFADTSSDCKFPIIIRPHGSQAGRDLEKIDSNSELLNYLNRVHGERFFVTRFIDYRSADGLYRKFRIAMIDGSPFACHMGVSSHWMIHYVNAGMYEESWKREEESDFMTTFNDFARKHHLALRSIYERVHLDYFCIDCAETKDAQFLVFELDNCMIVHAMDSEEMFPYKQVHMQKVKTAFQGYLSRLYGANK